MRLSFIKCDSSSQNPGSAATQGSFSHPAAPKPPGMRRDLQPCPAEPSWCVHGGRSWAGAVQGLVPGSPQPLQGHTSSKRPVRMEMIHLAQPALHRLGTDEAASKERGRGSSSRAQQQPRAGRSTAVSAQGLWGGQVPNSQTTAVGFAEGGQRGLLTSHRLRVAPQNQNAKNKEFERFGPRTASLHLLSPASPEPAEPTRGSLSPARALVPQGGITSSSAPSQPSGCSWQH